jgi:osmoprotectant transport system ATP-binding protein
VTTAPTTVALEARDVVVRYGSVTALDAVSLQVAAGECVALVGESGAGKTTLLRCFNHLTTVASGSIEVGGRGATGLRGESAVQARRSVGYVPQSGGLMPHWTVLRNAATVPWLLQRADAEAQAQAALALVGIPAAEFGGRYPGELSGGQRQRVAIARALAAKPETVLFDEPFGALDAITRSELHGVFEQLRTEVGFTALLVTHDLREAFRLADRVAVMKDGRIEQCAAGAELQSSPATDYVRDLLQRAGVTP